MRIQAAVALLGALYLAACSSTSAIDVLSVPVPSQEVTNSVRPSAPAEVAKANIAAAEEAPQDDLAAALVPPAEVAPPAAAAAAVVKPAVAAPAAKDIEHQVIRHRFKDAKPINFGRVQPHHYAVHGVDVSRWQGEINWPRLRAHGANFAYIKATDGGDHLDPMFKKNWRGAHEAGLKRGAYHFFYWCRTAGEQADWFIRNVPKVEGALPPVIDVEYNGESRCKVRLSRKRILEKMKVFMDKLEAHYGQRPIIYTAPDFYADNLEGEFLDYPFWLRAVAKHPSKVYPGRKWVFWQYSGSGLSQGVNEKIDLNVFNGSPKEWRDWLSGSTVVARR
jgi:Lyzozyme M1 (1,4-beta-N-acetylmuramidase)